LKISQLFWKKDTERKEPPARPISFARLSIVFLIFLESALMGAFLHLNMPERVFERLFLIVSFMGCIMITFIKIEFITENNADFVSGKRKFRRSLRQTKGFIAAWFLALVLLLSATSYVVALCLTRNQPDISQTIVFLILVIMSLFAFLINLEMMTWPPKPPRSA